MAIISDYDEQDNKPLSSSSVSKKPYNAVPDSPSRVSRNGVRVSGPGVGYLEERFSGE